jgi:5-methylcytosine-specific restriction endonuclease McrA
MKKTANGNSGSKWIRPVKRLAIYLRDNFECAYCRQDLTYNDPADITLDHVDGRCGGNAANRLVTACRRCNSAKAGHSLLTFVGSPAARAHITKLRRRSLVQSLKLAKSFLEDE